VQHHIVALDEDQVIFVFERSGKVADQVKQAVAPRFDVSTMLNIGIRPEFGRLRLVALVEERVEGLENKRLGLFS
jgi:hypothetical protein